MERTLLLIAAGLVLLMLVYVSTNPRRGASPDELERLSSIVPDDEWYQDVVLKNSSPVLVEFTATWCGYCRQLEGVLEEIKEDYGDRIKIIAVDVDDHPEVSQAYQIAGVPLLMVVKGGKVVEVAPGMMGYEAVEKLIQPYLADRPSKEKDDDGESAEQENESTALAGNS